MHGYLPIEDHGIVGDLHSVALVGTDGTVDWYCPGRFDAPSVFASILDSVRGGYWRISPALPGWKSKQLYLPDTNVLVTRFLTPEGVVEVEDFMPVAKAGEPHVQRLIRRVVGVKGALRVRMEIEPRFNYGRDPHELHSFEGCGVFRSPALSLAISIDAANEPERHEVTGAETANGFMASATIRAGETVTFTLETVGDDWQPRRYTEDETRELFTRTVAFWRGWLARSRYAGRWREMVNRSALTLKLLTYQPTGAIVAAPTTSLPEQIGGERNWDYRFTWIRDASFSLYALLRLGFTDEAEAFSDWLTERFRNCPGERGIGPLQLMYGIDGREDVPEEALAHLEGYRRSGPVRIGNHAATQLQLDIYGELMDSVYLYNRYGKPVYHDAWVQVRRVVDWIAENWDQADEGIWENRGGRRHFTYSRLMSWVALERAIQIARDRGFPADLVRWLEIRDAIYEQVMERGWSANRGAFVQHYESDALDASNLLMPLVKFISPTDPRWLSTLDAMSQELVSDSLVYRYNPAHSPDGLNGEEGTFSMCSFWYVDALARAGRLEDAQLAFEKMLTYANHVGLYAEEIGPTGEQLGNFPQAFTHLALISAAVTLDGALG